MAQPPVIRVPKPAHTSYQPDRPLWKNTLLQNQVRRFLEVEKTLSPNQPPGISVDEGTTEGDAAKYIRLMTKRLHRLPGEE
jgi:hypothetical protein